MPNTVRGFYFIIQKTFIFIFLLLSFSSKSQVDLNRGLAAYYPFNGNANDASGNNFHGALLNVVSFSTDRYGTPNAALQLDGINDFVQVIHDGG
jgi:hypothetical protein